MSRPLDDRGLPEGYVFRPDWEVTPRQVRAMRERGEDFVFLDCRTPREQQVASIEGAELVPLQQLGEHLPELQRRHAGRKLVIHCHHGGRSLQMASILRQHGFPDATSMAGGIDVWSMDIDPTVPRY